MASCGVGSPASGASTGAPAASVAASGVAPSTGTPSTPMPSGSTGLPFSSNASVSGCAADGGPTCPGPGLAGIPVTPPRTSARGAGNASSATPSTWPPLSLSPPQAVSSTDRMRGARNRRLSGCMSLVEVDGHVPVRDLGGADATRSESVEQAVVEAVHRLLPRVIAEPGVEQGAGTAVHHPAQCRHVDIFDHWLVQVQPSGGRVVAQRAG